MADFDSIAVHNPEKGEFMVRFNGEPYTLQSGETRHWPAFLAYHVAKHLSDQILGREVLKIKKDISDGNPYKPQHAQLMVYDNPSRRIALYDILGSKVEVENCIKAFNFKGFIGDMREYDEHVETVMQRQAKKAAKDTSEAGNTKDASPVVSSKE